MYRRPINCSAECSDGCSSSGSEEEDGSATQSFGTDEEEELDDRFILLAQSPNPNEFEYSEFFNTEAEKKTRLHQADSPVFFNGFPLLQMTAMDRG
ncbi:hypothetical protein BGZ54_009843 [Gamsiella multidivaricata]|nr:hypothetical protein BGZ54_009843 [Gamsiella multidivaricata]